MLWSRRRSCFHKSFIMLCNQQQAARQQFSLPYQVKQSSALEQFRLEWNCETAARYYDRPPASTASLPHSQTTIFTYWNRGLVIRPTSPGPIPPYWRQMAGGPQEPSVIALFDSVRPRCRSYGFRDEDSEIPPFSITYRLLSRDQALGYPICQVLLGTSCWWNSDAIVEIRYKSFNMYRISSIRYPKSLRPR